jgi:serine/threonine protein kinase
MGAPMELAGGSRVGPYEIGAPLGAGGRGVVYRARDTRLGRDAALKVLPDQVPASPDGKQVVAHYEDGHSSLLPLDGGELRPLTRMAPGEVAVGWADNGRTPFVRRAWRREQRGAEIVVHDLATGKERPWRTLAPADPTGMAHAAEISSVQITTDGRYYVYSYVQLDAGLFVAEGLR